MMREEGEELQTRPQLGKGETRRSHCVQQKPQKGVVRREQIQWQKDTKRRVRQVMRGEQQQARPQLGRSETMRSQCVEQDLQGGVVMRDLKRTRCEWSEKLNQLQVNEGEREHKRQKGQW